MIMRHAKSSWDNSALSDHERPLNARGRKAAPHVGLCLQGLGYQPERVFVSDSMRTSETWFGLSPFMGSPKVSFHQRLYGGELGDICQLVSQPAGRGPSNGWPAGGQGQPSSYSAGSSASNSTLDASVA